VINFYKYWAGVDFRDTYFKTITNPMDGMTALGVTDIFNLDTPDALTFHGVLQQFNGMAPTLGDILAYGPFGSYKVRVNIPAFDSKLIDGLTLDWDFGVTDSTAIIFHPQASLEFPRPNLGDVYVSIDEDNLYILWTVDMTSFDYSQIKVASVTGKVYLLWDDWMSLRGSWPVDPISYWTSSVTEVQIPLSNFFTDQWVEITISADDFRRDAIYVKI